MNRLFAHRALGELVQGCCDGGSQESRQVAAPNCECSFTTSHCLAQLPETCFASRVHRSAIPVRIPEWCFAGADSVPKLSSSCNRIQAGAQRLICSFSCRLGNWERASNCCHCPRTASVVWSLRGLHYSFGRFSHIDILLLPTSTERRKSGSTQPCSR